MRFPSFDSLRPYSYALLRIVTALLFMQHGAQKLIGVFGGFGPSHGAVVLASKMGVAGVCELGGGLLIALGLLTRPVAWILVIEMTVAYLTVHLPQGMVPIMNHGELPLLFIVNYLFIATHGPGAFSVDAALGFDREDAGTVLT